MPFRGNGEPPRRSAGVHGARPDQPRRSRGMLGSPLGERDAPAISSEPPKPRKEPLVQTPPRTSRYAQPKVLMGEVIGPRGSEMGEHRDAFRTFMQRRGLRPTDWARAAGVPTGEVLAYLTGHQRSLPPDTVEKLAVAAGVAIDEMFR